MKIIRAGRLIRRELHFVRNDKCGSEYAGYPFPETCGFLAGPEITDPDLEVGLVEEQVAGDIRKNRHEFGTHSLGVDTVTAEVELDPVAGHRQFGGVQLPVAFDQVHDGAVRNEILCPGYSGKQYQGRNQHQPHPANIRKIRGRFGEEALKKYNPAGIPKQGCGSDK